jgi:hypothetical protein
MCIAFWLASLKEGKHPENLRSDRRLMLKMEVKVNGYGGVEWTQVAQDRD